MSGPAKDVLEHYGTKGMKWGVRKEAALQRNTRLATGTASRREKLGYKLSVSGLDLYVAKKGGFSSVAQMRMTALQQQKDRINRGEATVRDKLDRQLNTPIIDLIRGR